MHVSREEDGRLFPNTAVFLAQDIGQATELAGNLGKKLASIALMYNQAFSVVLPS